MDHPVRAATGSRALAKSPPFSDPMDVSREFRARRMLRMPTPASMQVCAAAPLPDRSRFQQRKFQTRGRLLALENGSAAYPLALTVRRMAA